ncbi:RagB/SusD family nutrient uptake outer membrane protein [Galbibacter orientalis]|uniref:RagB/SusD family nutrient uptake outer membrane protein n=1 Tax=Galbibacter orientalis TaxID=453852 RepID=UPI003080479D
MRILKIILIGGLFFIVSCEKELIQNPNTDKVANNFYTNEAELEEGVNAVYATLQFGGNYDIAIPALGEIPGEDAYDETPANDGGVYGEIDQYNVIPQNGLIENVWRDAYKGIQRANIVLNRIEDIAYDNATTKKARIGEMLFIRSLYYFNLVRIFGDVPLVVEEIINPQDSFGQTRTPKEDVYNQIITDLTLAVDLLPNRNEGNKMRAVKTAAYTLLGKVYLTLGDYPNAYDNLIEVVKSKSHKLIPIEEVFSTENELNEEIIFAVQFASGINANSEGTDAYRMFNPTGRVEGNMTGTKGHGVLKPDFYDLYEEDDLRKGVYVDVLESGIAYSKKLAIPSTVIGDSESDWVVLRYAEVLLMLAEIENQRGNIDIAIGYLNEIRERVNLGLYEGLEDKNSVFNEIDLQRRLELVWEGHRWFDILRQNRAGEVLGVSDSNRLLMPIPAKQIATDSALEQNPGY